MFLLSRRVLKLIVSKIKIKEDKLGGEYCYTREDVIYDRTGHDFKHQLRIKIPLKKNIPPEIILQENEKEDTTKIKDELRKIKNQIIQEKEDYIKNYLYVNEKDCIKEGNCFVYKSKVSFNDYSVAVWEKGKLLGYKKLNVNLDTRRKSWTIKITDTIKVPKVHMDIVDENLIKIQIYEFKNIA